MKRIAVLKFGLWKLRREIGSLTGMAPVWSAGLPLPRFDAVAGWGHGRTAGRARRLAERSGKPYLAFEDGPLRSVKPGPKQPPMSLVLDRSGIYYDAATSSELFSLITDRTWLTPAILERAARGADQLRKLRLSKYNSGPELTPEQLGLAPAASRRILVLDQVRGDASIRGALAGEKSFEDMLAEAFRAEPDAEIVVKQHPDVLSGRRKGYFDAVTAGGRITLVRASVNPWSLLDAVDTVYTVSSGMGFEAVLAGKAVVTFGSPFYAGWGFTDDRRLAVTRPAPAAPAELFAAYYLRYTRYFDAYTREEIAFEAAADQLAWLRDRFVEQPRRAICHRITHWKRTPVDRLLDGAAGKPLHTSHTAETIASAEKHHGVVVAWSSRDNAALEAACAERKIPFVRVEDGFVRSAGLGASFVLPLSLVFDALGIYYDPRTESGLERIIQTADFPPAMLQRAARLREKLVAAGMTKYNVAAASEVRIESHGRPVILVPGQVEDDASIRYGSPLLKRNVDLLEAVRRRHPDSYIVYKPHPDVEAGYRNGHVAPEDAARFADQVVLNAPILALIGLCDRVETITSLAGFEALLRGKPVTAHGQPFYAGWGLTEDLCPVGRRTRRVSLDALVAATLIAYPRYIDPLTWLPCPPEILVERLAAELKRKRGATERLARLGRIAIARALHFGQTLKDATRRNT